VTKKEFRQATIWALDRETLVNDVLEGTVRVADVMNQWIAAWAIATDLQRYDPQDVARAKQLLATSGYAGEEIQVSIYPPTFGADIPVILQLWKDIGIATKTTPITDASFVEDFYLHPKYDIAFSYGFGTLDGSPWGSDTYLSSDQFPETGGYNATRFNDAEWDSEYTAALLSPDVPTQAPHFARCSEIFNDELPFVPLYQRVDIAMVGKGLHGPERSTILHPAVGGVRYWEWYVAS
jgi:peptide/nickel transport system substrate-binding protein